MEHLPDHVLPTLPGLLATTVRDPALRAAVATRIMPIIAFRMRMQLERLRAREEEELEEAIRLSLLEHQPPPAQPKKVPLTPHVITWTEWSDGQECVICLNRFMRADDVVKLSCGHLFHRACVEAWTAAHDTCPHCRSDVGV